VRIGLPATKWMVEIGAFFMRTDTELVLKSRWVVPKRLLDAGFTFASAAVRGRKPSRSAPRKYSPAEP